MCEDCRVRALERKRAQFDEPKARPIKKGGRHGYESKSKKVWRDRFEAARKDLKHDVERYRDALARGWITTRSDHWMYNKVKRVDWYAKRYCEARAEAKAHGAI